MENLILGVRWSPAPSSPGSNETFFTLIAHLPWDQCWSFQFSSNKLFVLSQVGLMSVTYLSLGNTFGRTLTFCFCQFEISTLRSSTCSFCLFLSLVILLHVRKYLYVPNSLIIYPRTCQKSPQKNTHLSIDLSITLRVFWSGQLAGPPGRFAVCPWRNGIPQVSIWFEGQKRKVLQRDRIPKKKFSIEGHL